MLFPLISNLVRGFCLRPIRFLLLQICYCFSLANIKIVGGRSECRYSVENSRNSRRIGKRIKAACFAFPFSLCFSCSFIVFSTCSFRKGEKCSFRCHDLVTDRQKPRPLAGSDMWWSASCVASQAPLGNDHSHSFPYTFFS